MKYACGIAAIALMAVTPAFGQARKAPPAVCALYQQSLAQFAAVKDNASAVAASKAHIERMERKPLTAARLTDIEALVAGAGWRQWIIDARGDLAGEMTARSCN